ncbi:MAG: ATP-dependent 6-phosphofructokinase [Bdellovibrio sp.]|nr:ATP-dependent 6-phosphofructokinase [Bdellovibrio sp.]
MTKRFDFSIPVLGEANTPSPLMFSNVTNDYISDFTSDDARILYDPTGMTPENFFTLAGPRKHVFFKGEEVVVGIVNCGGLCPGMNNVTRGLVRGLWYSYGVRKILGIRYGFLGLTDRAPQAPMILNPDVIRDIHLLGGTILGSSRGPQSISEMVDTLNRLGINILFTVGGDGTMHGALALYEEVCRRNARIAIIGVPKTIDNDMLFIEKTFGFETAVSIASDAIRAAHVEAVGTLNGVGLVHLMGRYSGFIAASAVMACREANLVLVPEIPFDIHGPHGLLQYVRERLHANGHVLIVVAEGAGQEHLPKMQARDASGNLKLADIGVFIRDELIRELGDEGISLKYIDPSYIVRAAPANAGDSIFCGQLAEEAVHAAMAGKTGMVVGLWLGRFTYVPLTAVTVGRQVISPDSTFWRNVLESTGQPALLKPRKK